MRDIAGLVVAAGVTAVTLVVLVPWLTARGILDVPESRSSHAAPVPRGGGIAFAVGIAAGIAVAGPAGWPGVTVAAGAVGVVGFVDDVRTLGAAFRMAVQVSVAALLVVWLFGEARPWATPSGPWAITATVVAIAWIVGYVNAFNFMDGINGITAAQMIVVGLAWTLAGTVGDVPALVPVGLVTAAAAAAFLPWNVPNAAVFPGDAGSYFAGVWLAAWAVIAVASGVPAVTVASPFAITLADTSTTLVRRVLAGERWHQAHRQHAYQRAVAAGWSHARVSALVAGSMALTSAFGMAALAGPWWGVAGALGATIVVVLYLTLPGRIRSPMLREERR